MSLEDLGSLSDLIAAIATIGTLLYLGLQIRQNTRTVKASVKDSLSKTMLEINGHFFADIESTRIWHTGRLNLATLSELERAQFSGFVLMSLYAAENNYFQGKEGLAEHGYNARNERWIDWFSRQSGIVEMWPGIRDFLTDEFQEVFDARIKHNADSE
ncbi:MAG: hypothetical protein AAF512_24120 [Pseudomonadota bacterium]